MQQRTPAACSLKGKKEKEEERGEKRETREERGERERERDERGER